MRNPSVYECQKRLIGIGNVARELVQNIVSVERYSDRWDWSVTAIDDDGGQWDLITLRYRPLPAKHVETMGGEVC